MKKILVLLFILFAPCVFADDYLDSLRESGNEVRENLSFSTTSPSVPDSLVFDKIRSAYVVFSQLFMANDSADTITMVRGTYDYAIDTAIIKIKSVFFKSGDSLMSLKMAPKENWQKLYDGEPRVLSSFGRNDGWNRHPAYYDWYPGRVQFYATPISADTIIIYTKVKTVDIMTDSVFVSQFPVSYRPAVISYATYLTAMSKQMFTEANQWLGNTAFLIKLIDSTIDMREYRFEEIK